MSTIAVVATTEDATARATRIRAGMVSLVRFKDDVITAYQMRDWQALGYDGWDAYMAGEFGEHRVRLPREQRLEITAGMREAGMSTRAIGTALGVSQATTAREARESNDSPAPVTGTDGKTYAPKAKVTETTKTEYDVDTATGEVTDPRDSTPAASPPSRPGSNPIADAKANVARQPAILAGKAIARLRIARLTFEAAGDGPTVVTDLFTDPIGDAAADLWLEELDATAAVIADLAAALRRRHIRSAP